MIELKFNKKTNTYSEIVKFYSWAIWLENDFNEIDKKHIDNTINNDNINRPSEDVSDDNSVSLYSNVYINNIAKSLFKNLNNHIYLLEHALKCGVDINGEDKLGNTPLLWALANGNFDTVSLLLDIFKDKLDLHKSGTKYDNAPFPFLAAKGYKTCDSGGREFKLDNCSYIDLAKKMIELDPSIINDTCRNGLTALHIAYLRGDT